VGTWNVTWELPSLPGNLKYEGTQQSDLDVNGRWLIEKWPGLITLKGEWNRGDKTMTWHEVTDSKKSRGQTMRLRIVDKNAHTLTIFPSSFTKEEDAIFRIEYRRKS